MRKVAMPEPVAYFYQRDFDKYKDRYTGGIPVITIDQAEVYADARVREAQQWVSVDDRLPSPETDVLVKVDGKFGARTHDIAGLFRDEWMSQITEDIVRGRVTHWMPLPEPPTE